MFLVTQVLSICKIWQYCQSSSLWNIMLMLYVGGIDVAPEQYKTKHLGKHETVFLDTFLLYLYLPIFCHNNVTHISSSVSHSVQSYMDTLLPFPCNNNNNNNHYHKRLGASVKFPNGISTSCVMRKIGTVAHYSPVWIIPPLPLKSIP